jgi:hypothetical protein
VKYTYPLWHRCLSLFDPVHWFARLVKPIFAYGERRVRELVEHLDDEPQHETRAS